MGSVWRARQLSLNAPVAVKLIDAAIAGHPDALQRFAREARALAELRSAHIVQTLDFGTHAGVPFIVMELLEGETLTARLRRLGKLTPYETALLLQQVGRAVGKAHALGIVHRDLKPDNLFISGEAGAEIVKVLDFGVAKTRDAQLDGLTATGALLGTPYYMSPEQAEGRRGVDRKSDLWALGVIAFECLLGRRPFQGQTFSEVLVGICSREPPLPSSLGPVPAGFDTWFARACARAPESRFGDVRESIDGFCALIADAPRASYSPPMGMAEDDAATLAVSSIESLETLALPTTGSGLSRSATLPAAKSPLRRPRAELDWFAIALCGAAMLLGSGLFAAFQHFRALPPPAPSVATQPTASASALPKTVSASPIRAPAPPSTLARAPSVEPLMLAPRIPRPAQSARPASPRPAPGPRPPRERPSADLGF